MGSVHELGTSINYYLQSKTKSLLIARFIKISIIYDICSLLQSLSSLDLLD